MKPSHPFNKLNQRKNRADVFCTAVFISEYSEGIKN
jgi:hypothetical protein